MSAMSMTATSQLKTNVGLTFSCRNLPSKDVLSASDPVILLSRWDGFRWARYGRTEPIKNERNPQFRHVLQTDYFFEQEQRFRCDVYDADSNWIDDFSRHDHIGYTEFTLGRLMSAASSTIKILLTKPNGTPRSKAYIIIRGDEQKNNSEFAWVDIQAINLKKKSLLLGKDDTYITFTRRRADGAETLVYRSEIVMNTQSPRWRPFKISMGALTDCLPDATFIMRVSHQREGLSSSKPEVIGEVIVSVNEAMRADNYTGPDKVFTLSSQKNSGSQGQLKINRFHVFREDTFLQYIAGGLDMRLVVAVDFTGSNGPPQDPRSLHHRVPGRFNEYEAAIHSVGNILCSYTQKLTFPTFGFGAVVNGQAETSHCFPLDFGTPMASQPGVDGIIARYHYAINRVQLSGPTYFHQIINTVEAMSREPFRPDYQHYTTLLILTDGVINDVAQTVDSVVRCSDKPLSIIIIGVGGANFKDMHVLDADQGALRSGPLVAKRDCVQFVPMRSVANAGPAAIASQVLAELPQQVTAFMNLHGIRALAPREGAANPQSAISIPVVTPDVPAPTPGAPAPGYGAPAPGAPAPGYGAPAPGAPAPGYGAPAPGAPALGAPAPGYGAPAPGAPAPGYGAPAPGAPAPGYGAPAPGAPAPGYGAPAPGYGAPAPGYGAPAPGYGAPAPGYGAPAPGYGAPAPGYGAPAPGAPAPGYGAPAPGAPAPGYGAPAPGYGAPAPGYGAPAPGGYGAPAAGYQAPSGSGYPGAQR